MSSETVPPSDGSTQLSRSASNEPGASEGSAAASDASEACESGDAPGRPDRPSAGGSALPPAAPRALEAEAILRRLITPELGYAWTTGRGDLPAGRRYLVRAESLHAAASDLTTVPAFLPGLRIRLHLLATEPDFQLGASWWGE